jgi:hypothetical protein
MSIFVEWNEAEFEKLADLGHHCEKWAWNIRKIEESESMLNFREKNPERMRFSIAYSCSARQDESISNSESFVDRSYADLWDLEKWDKFEKPKWCRNMHMCWGNVLESILGGFWQVFFVKTLYTLKKWDLKCVFGHFTKKNEVWGRNVWSKPTLEFHAESNGVE